MEEQNIEKYIEAYLSGQLSDADKKSFEDRLHEDIAFKKQYENQLIANKLIEIDYAKSLSKLVHKERTSSNAKEICENWGNSTRFLAGCCWVVLYEFNPS